jgi:hypothetical protein
MASSPSNWSAQIFPADRKSVIRAVMISVRGLSEALENVIGVADRRFA